MTYLADRSLKDRWVRSTRRPLSLGDLSAFLPFPSSVEAWRSLLDRYRGDIPLDYLLAWLQKESGGDPCSYTSLRESGIFQLMPPDNTNVAGTTEAALRAACSGGSGSLTRNLTDAEANLQVASGIQYVRWARDQARRKLAAAGASWSESSPDFWAMVKLQHAYPAPTAGWLAAATAKYGRPPQNWAEFRSAIDGFSGVLDNAEWVGFRANPGVLGGISPVWLAIGVGGIGLLYLLSR